MIGTNTCVRTENVLKVRKMRISRVWWKNVKKKHFMMFFWDRKNTLFLFKKKKNNLILGNDKAETAAKAAGADTCLRFAGLWSKGCLQTKGTESSWFTNKNTQCQWTQARAWNGMETAKNQTWPHPQLTIRAPPSPSFNQPPRSSAIITYSNGAEQGPDDSVLSLWFLIERKR